MALSVILTVIGYAVLPDTVKVQLSIGGTEANTLPKLLALLLPGVLTAGGGAALLFAGVDAKQQKRFTLLTGVGLLIYILMFAVNL